MRVFVAGATGAIGTQLVPRLVAAGHEVHGMTRNESKRAMLDELGAVPVVADALDLDQVAEAVDKARPEVIVHQLTAIGALDLRHFDRAFAPTNRLRTEGTDYLLSAGQNVGVRRFVAQAAAGYGAYGRTGGPARHRHALSLSPGLDPGLPANRAAWERPVSVPGGVCIDGSLAVGQCEIAIEVTRVQSPDRGQLIDDHLRLRPRHGLRDLTGIKRVRDHRHGAQIAEHRLL